MGIILFNKEPGITSFRALFKIKKELGTRKVGHTGTLDSFAEGLLVALTGKALKLAQWFTKCDKEYIGTICFGTETDTLDPQGNVIASAPVPLREDLEKTLLKFTGKIMQAPPLYSAIHINGKRASDLARADIEVKMKEREVTIYKLELMEWHPPYAKIFVHCSSGTYIRSLARDIALSLSSRAHLSSLKRTKVGAFSLDMINDNEKGFTLLPLGKDITEKLGFFSIEVKPQDAQNIFHGKPLEQILHGADLKDFQEAAVYCGEDIIAIIERQNGKWKYSCVFSG